MLIAAASPSYHGRVSILWPCPPPTVPGAVGPPRAGTPARPRVAGCPRGPRPLGTSRGRRPARPEDVERCWGCPGAHRGGRRGVSRRVSPAVPAVDGAAGGGVAALSGAGAVRCAGTVPACGQCCRAGIGAALPVRRGCVPAGESGALPGCVGDTATRGRALWVCASRTRWFRRVAAGRGRAAPAVPPASPGCPRSLRPLAVPSRGPPRPAVPALPAALRPAPVRRSPRGFSPRSSRPLPGAARSPRRC